MDFKPLQQQCSRMCRRHSFGRGRKGWLIAFRFGYINIRSSGGWCSWYNYRLRKALTSEGMRVQMCVADVSRALSGPRRQESRALGVVIITLQRAPSSTRVEWLTTCFVGGRDMRRLCNNIIFALRRNDCIKLLLLQWKRWKILTTAFRVRQHIIIIMTVHTS